MCIFHRLTTNFTKWSIILKQFADELFECFDGFVGLALKGLTKHLLWRNLYSKLENIVKKIFVEHAHSVLEKNM